MNYDDQIQRIRTKLVEARHRLKEMGLESIQKLRESMSGARYKAAAKAGGNPSFDQAQKMKRLLMNQTTPGLRLLALLGLSWAALAVDEDEDRVPQNNVIPAEKKPIGPGELYYLMGQACQHGDDMGVQMLLNAGAEPDGVNDYKEFMRFEPTWHLHRTAYGGHLKIVDMLLQAGAKVDLQCGEGETALFMAVYQNHPKVVERLLEAGAETGIKVNGKTALDVARTKKLAEIVALLERGRAARSRSK